MIIIAIALATGLPSMVEAQSFLKTRVKNVEGQQSSILKEAGENELIVLDFWATWCKPCVKALPEIMKLAVEFKDSGVAFIGINEDTPRNLSKVRPFVLTHQISYPVLLDTNQEIMNELLVNAFPTLMIINKKGEVLYTHRGFSNGDEKHLRSKLKEVLGQ